MYVCMYVGIRTWTTDSIHPKLQLIRHRSSTLLCILLPIFMISIHCVNVELYIYIIYTTAACVPAYRSS